MSGSLFNYVDLSVRVPINHPLRKIRRVDNKALARLDAEFGALYVDFGRRSIAPLLSDEHFLVDGTLVKAWASMTSFWPKAEDAPPEDEGPGDPPGYDTAADQPAQP